MQFADMAACSEDCKRTIRSYVDKMRMVCQTVFMLAGQRYPGVFENLMDADLLGKFDAFRDVFVTMVNERTFPKLFLGSTIDEAYAVQCEPWKHDVSAHESYLRNERSGMD